jgi:hypothetical protein
MLSAYTIVKNGVKFEYPIREAILSVVHFSDEIIVNYGKSDDGTFEILIELQNVVKDISCGKTQLKIFNYEWGKSGKQNWLGEQKDNSSKHCSYKWRFIFDIDDVFHEKNIDTLLGMITSVENKNAFDKCRDYLFLSPMVHFYNDYSTILRLDSEPSREKYVKFYYNGSGHIEHIGDGWNIGVHDKYKPIILKGGFEIFHYGHVKTPRSYLNKMREHITKDLESEKDKARILYLSKLLKYFDNIKDSVNSVYDVSLANSSMVEKFCGTHPKIMEKRIELFNSTTGG